MEAYRLDYLILGHHADYDTPGGTYFYACKTPDGVLEYAEQATRAMETGGVEECARLLKDVYDSRAENARALAYRLFTIADKKGWNGEAFAYNSLVVAWPEIQTRAAQLQAATPKQYTLEDLAGMEGDE